ncbi:MAG: DMT family transporter [Coprococcus sp.]
MSESSDREQWMQKTVVVWLGAMLCCALWGSAFPFVKIGYRLFNIVSEDTASQILFAGCRFTLAGMMAVFIGSIAARQFLHPTRDNIGRVLWLSFLQTVLQYLFFYIGLAHTSGVKASIIEAVNVFVAILVASILFHQEKLTFQKLAGCMVGFAGVVLINLNGMNFEMSLQGEGFIFLSTVAYAFSSVFLKRFSVKDNTVMLSGYQFIMGGIIMVIVGIVMGGHINVPSGKAVVLLLYLAMVSAVAYSVWGLLLKYNPVSRVAVFGFMNPVFGVILSAVFLHESDQASGWTGILSLILVCIGIYVVNYSKTQINRAGGMERR